MGNHTSTIKDIYEDKHGFYKNFKITDKHKYHVFESRIKSICGEIKFKETIKHNSKNYRVTNAYLGVLNQCKLVYHPYKNRSIDYLTFEGTDMNCLIKTIKFILHVTELKKALEKN
jgi:hypothetical protein